MYHYKRLIDKKIKGNMGKRKSSIKCKKIGTTILLVAVCCSVVFSCLASLQLFNFEQNRADFAISKLHESGGISFSQKPVELFFIRPGYSNINCEFTGSAKRITNVGNSVKFNTKSRNVWLYERPEIITRYFALPASHKTCPSEDPLMLV